MTQTTRPVEETHVLVVNPNGYMFAVAKNIGIDTEALTAKGNTITNTTDEMYAKASEITGQPIEEVRLGFDTIEYNSRSEVCHFDSRQCGSSIDEEDSKDLVTYLTNYVI